MGTICENDYLYYIYIIIFCLIISCMDLVSTILLFYKKSGKIHEDHFLLSFYALHEM